MQEWTVDMTGQLSPPKRAQFWKTKRVFFVTPQVLEKDIHSGDLLISFSFNIVSLDIYFLCHVPCFAPSDMVL